MTQNYLFYIKENLDAFAGEWIAIFDKQVVSHGKNPKKVLDEAKAKFPRSRPLLAKVPDERTMLF